jgi:hypothetical protein
MTDRDPLVVSSAGSMLSGLLAVWFVATSPNQRFAIGVIAVGLAALWLAVRGFRRGHRLLGGVLGVAGLAAAVFAFTRGGAGPLSNRLELYPALVGLLVLTLGLAPVYRGFERWYVTTGTALVFVGVVTAGAVQSASTFGLLAAGVATVVAWDLGEQAVNVRNHVGADARTWPVELTHAGAAVVVGAAVIALALFVRNAQVTGVPLAGLGVLLGAAVVLTTALYN